jgi:hypothetical protein
MIPPSPQQCTVDRKNDPSFIVEEKEGSFFYQQYVVEEKEGSFFYQQYIVEWKEG